MKSWIQEAGFEIVTESDVPRTTADYHELSADDRILGRDVDQFLFIVRKPQRCSMPCELAASRSRGAAIPGAVARRSG